MDEMLSRSLIVVGFGCVLLALFLYLFVRDESSHRRKLVAGLLLSTGLGLLAAFLN